MGLEFSKEGHVAKVGLNVPETKNAFSTGLLMDLCNVWDECQKDHVIRSVVVYSALPDVFCSGMDMMDSLPLLTGDRLPGNSVEKFFFNEENGFIGYNKALLKKRYLIKPVIAAINGWCLTSGFELTMGADLRIASNDAKFQMRGTKLGIQALGGGNIYLPAIVGNTRALEILLTGDVYPARTMLEWGFLNKVVPSNGNYLMEEAMALAEKLASCGPKSQQGMIKLNRLSKGLSFEEAFKLEFEIALTVLRSNDPAEGISAQKEKRKANFDD
jgi:enoyl-CoA hydratase